MKRRILIYLSCLMFGIVSVVAVIMGTNYIVEVHEDSVKVSDYTQLSVEEIIVHSDKPYPTPTPDPVPTPTPNPNPIEQTDLEKAMEAQGLKKAHWLASAYYQLQDTYPDDFLCGLLGCINAEGTPGLMESLNYSTSGNSRILHDECPYMNAAWRASHGQQHVYWYPGHKRKNICWVHEFQVRPEGHKVLSDADCNALLKLDDDSNQPGVGMCQWSGSRRRTLLNLYLNRNNGDYSEENLFSTEVEMIRNELSTSYAGTVGRCQLEGAYNTNTEDSVELACKWIFATYEFGKTDLSQVGQSYFDARVPAALACWRAVQTVKSGGST